MERCVILGSMLRHGPRVRRARVGLGLATALLAMTASCGLFGREECDCLPTGFTVVIPRALTATELRLEGEACTGAEVRCGSGSGLVNASPENLCASDNHYVDPVGPGLCRVTVELDGRAPFTRDVEIERGTDGELYAVGQYIILVE